MKLEISSEELYAILKNNLITENDDKHFLVALDACHNIHPYVRTVLNKDSIKATIENRGIVCGDKESTSFNGKLLLPYSLIFENIPFCLPQ